MQSIKIEINRKVVSVGVFLLVSGFFLALLYGSLRPTQDTDRGKELPTISFETSSGEKSINVEVADNDLTRAKGLMNRTTLPLDRGMIFIFDEDIQHSFWMKNTKIPLDMIFISSDGVIVDIQHNAQPCTTDPCPSYSSDSIYRYVIETNGGWSEAGGVKIGDKVDLSEVIK